MNLKRFRDTIKVKTQSQKDAKYASQLVIERDRENKLENLKKWDNFKARRNEIIDKYIRIKR